MRGRLPGWAVVAIAVAFAICEALLLNVRIRDFDEGVYWQSLAAMARSEPLFSSVFASQPPAFYYLLLPLYLVGRSLASLRLTVALIGIVGLVALYWTARLVAGRAAGLVAVALGATSWLYFHQSAILQADGPSVAVSMVAVLSAVLAGRNSGPPALLLAAAAGLALVASAGIKLMGAITVIPVAIALLGGRPIKPDRLLAGLAGGVLGLILVLIPAAGAPGEALDQLVLVHLRAAGAGQQTLGENLQLLLYRRELPLECLALISLAVAILRRQGAILFPASWSAAAFLSLLLYHPLFPHHVVILALPLALTAAVGLGEIATESGVRAVAFAALVLATAVAGAYVVLSDIKLAFTPDLHNAEMVTAVTGLGRSSDFWITDNPYAIAAGGRAVPGPLVDMSSQRIRAGLLTVTDLERARTRYQVRWILEDSFRLDIAPNYREWLGAHYHAVENLGGRAVIYEGNQP